MEYYCKLPKDIEKRQIFVVDPMLATGGSASAAIDFIKERGGRNITFMCLIAAPEGIDVLQKRHPDVDIYIAAKDQRLNEHAYIVPGTGRRRGSAVRNQVICGVEPRYLYDRGKFSKKEEEQMKNFIPDNVSQHDNVFDVLKERGFIEQVTDEDAVREMLGKEKIKFYIGLTLRQTACTLVTSCRSSS